MLLAASTVIVAQSMIPLAASAETGTNTLAESIEAEAKKHLGLHYVWGGSTPAGFDCSGLIQFVFAKHGIKLPRTAAEQFRVGDHVETQNLQKGDLVFFTTYKPGASHVGIYLGNGKFIDANNSGLMISDFNAPYWQNRYLGAKRIFSETDKGIVFNTSVSKTKTLPSVQTVFELNEDNQTYTVQRGNSIIEIASHFNITTDQLIKWNNFDSIGTSLSTGQKLFVKKPQLSLTLFDANVEEVIQEEIEPEFTEEPQTTAESIKLKVIEKVTSKEDSNDIEDNEQVNSIIVTSTDFLPTQHFTINDDVKSIFEKKALTRAEAAVALYHLEQKNPSFNKAFSEDVNVQSIKDVSDDHWAKDAIDWVLQTNLLTVNKEEKFNPEQPFNEEAANIVMERILERYTINENEINLIQKQVSEDSNWSLSYFNALTFNISENLVALENQATNSQTEESINNDENKKSAPSVKLASERMTQYIMQTKSLFSSN